MGHGASVHGDGLEDGQEANSTLALALERMPTISCKVGRVPERNVAPIPAALQLLRTLGNRTDPMEISFCLKHDYILLLSSCHKLNHAYFISNVCLSAFYSILF